MRLTCANIQQPMVDADQGVRIAELRAQSAIRSANGEAESTKLRALGEADPSYLSSLCGLAHACTRLGQHARALALQVHTKTGAEAAA